MIRRISYFARVGAHGFTFFRGSYGFTLAEGLVSLALLGLMAGLLALAVAGAVTFPARGADRLARLDAVATAQALIRTRIETLAPGRLDGSGIVYADVRGTARQFDFSAPAPDADGPQEYRRYRLGLAPDGTLTLWTLAGLSRNPDPRLPGLDGWAAQPILDGVTDVAIDYYGDPGGGGRDAWRTVWLQGRTPPSLVRLRLRFAPGDRRLWPDLVVRIAAQTPPFCEADARTGGCAVFN